MTGVMRLLSTYAKYHNADGNNKQGAPRVQLVPSFPTRQLGKTSISARSSATGTTPPPSSLCSSQRGAAICGA